MGFPKSIRFTLTLRYCLTLAVILGLFSSFFYLTIRNHFYREVDTELLSIAQALASSTMEPFVTAAPTVLDQVLEDFIGPKVSGKYVRLFDSNGRITASSSNLKGNSFPLDTAVLKKTRKGIVDYRTDNAGGHIPVRRIILPVMQDDKLIRIVQVFAPLENTTAILEHIENILTISIPVAILLFAYGGWFMAGIALRPVELVTKSAGKITAENLGKRLEVPNPRDEIGRLAATFNAVLANLEESFKRTRRFSVDISHELRTPLTILRGETEMGLKLAKDPDEFREILRSNLDEINQMAKMIENLLFLAKAEEGGLYLDLQELVLQDFMEEVVLQMSSVAESQGKELRFESRVGGARIRGDKSRLQQVFVHLIDNALRYTSVGGAVRIGIEPDQDEEHAVVSVTDTGAGIPAEDLPFIFDRFYRVEKSRNRAQGGTGMGLSVARSFTVAHGGRIDVDSRPGEGSRFMVHLPLLPPLPE